MDSDSQNLKDLKEAKKVSKKVSQDRIINKNNRRLRPPLNGCDAETSDKLRSLIGARFSGFTLEESAKQIGMSISAANSLRIRHPEAYAEAQQEHVQRSLEVHHGNMYILNSLLSDMGPRAMKAIDKILRAKATKPETRLKAAQLALEMLGMNHRHVASDPSEGHVPDNLRYIKKQIETLEDSYVVDAEEVTVEQD